MAAPRNSTDEIETEEDRLLFAELDSYSKQLRQSAGEFAQSFANAKNKPKEIELLIFALQKIQTIDIKKMDTAINNFKKCIASLALKNSGENIFGESVKPTQLPDIFQKYNLFINDVMDLSQKSLELSVKNLKQE